MSFQLRHQAWGLVTSVLGLTAYWIVIIVRAATDDESFTNVAWQHPLLWFIGAGAVVYSAIYGAAWWTTRGEVRTDERDVEIARWAETASSGLTSMGALIAMILLALGVGSFWAAHAILTLSFLGTLASTGMSISAYYEGLER